MPLALLAFMADGSYSQGRWGCCVTLDNTELIAHGGTVHVAGKPFPGPALAEGMSVVAALRAARMHVQTVTGYVPVQIICDAGSFLTLLYERVGLEQGRPVHFLLRRTVTECYRNLALLALLVGEVQLRHKRCFPEHDRKKWPPHFGANAGREEGELELERLLHDGVIPDNVSWLTAYNRLQQASLMLGFDVRFGPLQFDRMVSGFDGDRWLADNGLPSNDMLCFREGDIILPLPTIYGEHPEWRSGFLSGNRGWYPRKWAEMLVM